MKTITWILTAALLVTMLAYTVVKERRGSCEVQQLSQVLK
ncbi:hypothetical protein PHLH4_39910 [Pseudomonas sp. St316]|nr:hypothetical protein PHLH4_39910 [Pseudomonas sp. St316]